MFNTKKYSVQLMKLLGALGAGLVALGLAHGLFDGTSLGSRRSDAPLPIGIGTAFIVYLLLSKKKEDVG